MIYIITMHHNTDKFLALQARYLYEYTSEDYRVFCGVSGFGEISGTQPRHIKNHLFIDLSPIYNQHWFRMNYIYDAIAKGLSEGTITGIEHATFQPDDLLVFLDGDAFPMDTWVPKIRDYLSSAQAASVYRLENPEPLLDEQHKPYPHPLFFVTRAAFWEKYDLMWEHWEEYGISTPGPLLKRWFMGNNFEIAPLTRTNAFDIHPVFFGIYDEIIYHHGASAGVTSVYDSVDIWNRPALAEKYGTSLDLKHPVIPEFNAKLSQVVYDEILQNDNFIKIYLGGAEYTV